MDLSKAKEVVDSGDLGSDVPFKSSQYFHIVR